MLVTARVRLFLLPVAALIGCSHEAAINEFTVEHHEVPVADATDSDGTQDKWAKLEYISAVATPGPWESDEQIIGWMGGDFPSVRIGHVTKVEGDGITSGPVAMCPAEYGTGQPLTDARFIAAARTGLPEAIARIRELEAEVAVLRAEPAIQTTTGDNSPIILGARGSVTIKTTSDPVHP